MCCAVSMDKHYRVQLLRKEDKGGYGFLFDRYPCFKKCSYVYHAFEAQLKWQKKTAVLQDIHKGLELFFSAIAELIMQLQQPNDQEFYIAAIHYLECELKAKKSIVEQINDVADADLMKKLETKELDSPRIRIVRKDKQITGVFVVGDGAVTHVNGVDVFRATAVLLAMYYAFDLQYPTTYQSILRLIQKVSLNKGPFTGPVNKSLAFVVKKLNSAVEKVTSK